MLKIYEWYRKKLLLRPNVLFVKYENMIQGFRGWLASLTEYLELDVPADSYARLLQEDHFGIQDEDVYSHKRQVQAGDHKRKLKPETIALLNNQFREVLAALNYPE